MIALTWLVPAGVFFTSIIGWQYFVGDRSVPAERCYVQYMENAIFNFILQVLAQTTIGVASYGALGHLPPHSTSSNLILFQFSLELRRV